MNRVWKPFKTVPRDGSCVIVARLIMGTEVTIVATGEYNEKSRLWNFSGDWADEAEDMAHGIAFVGWAEFPGITSDEAKQLMREQEESAPLPWSGKTHRPGLGNVSDCLVTHTCAHHADCAKSEDDTSANYCPSCGLTHDACTCAGG